MVNYISVTIKSCKASLQKELRNKCIDHTGAQLGIFLCVVGICFQHIIKGDLSVGNNNAIIVKRRVLI